MNNALAQRPRVEIFANVIDNYRRMYRERHGCDCLGSNYAILAAWDHAKTIDCTDSPDQIVLCEMEWMFVPA